MFIQRLVPFPAVGKEFLFSSLYLSFSLYFLLEATLIWSTQAYLYIKIFNILILSAGFFCIFQPLLMSAMWFWCVTMNSLRVLKWLMKTGMLLVPQLWQLGRWAKKRREGERREVRKGLYCLYALLLHIIFISPAKHLFCYRLKGCIFP